MFSNITSADSLICLSMVVEVENMELEKWLNSSISEEIRKIEKGNDSYKYDNVATQKDFDKF